MAEDLLVSEHLTPEMIQSGAALLSALDALALTVKAAFWLLLPDQRVWRLFIATPAVRSTGPKAVYRRIQSALSRLPKDLDRIAMKDVSAIDDKAPLVSLLRSAVSVSAGSPGIRFARNVIDGQLIEDAYLYRVA